MLGFSHVVRLLFTFFVLLFLFEFLNLFYTISNRVKFHFGIKIIPIKSLNSIHEKVCPVV